MKGRIRFFFISLIFILSGCQSNKRIDDKITKQIVDKGWEIETNYTSKTIGAASDAIYVTKNNQLFYIVIRKPEDEVVLDKLGYSNTKNNQIIYLYTNFEEEAEILVRDSQNQMLCKSSEEDCNIEYQKEIEDTKRIMDKALKELDLSLEELSDWGKWYMDEEVYKKSSYTYTRYYIS